MADVIVDGKVAVWFIPTMAGAGPTVAEMAAGTKLSNVMTADGLVGFEPVTAEVDTTSLESTFDTVAPGRASYTGCALRLKKQATTDTLYATTLVREQAGYIVVRRDLTATTAVAAAQKVEIYPSVFGETKNLAPEKNSVARYEVPVLVSAAPTLRGTVLA